jgi:hypothetical protein
MMSEKEPEVMRTLHEIREKQHEETKDLSDEEWVKRIKDKSDACMEKYELKLPVRIKVKK